MNYLFFEHIARVPLQEYVTRFQSIAQTEEMTDLLIAQVWANAQVATLKYAHWLLPFFLLCIG